MKMIANTSHVLPRFLDELLHTPWTPSTHTVSRTTPAVNITEEEKAFTLAFAIPGKSKDDFEIEVENEVLSVRTSTEHEDTVAAPHFRRREFYYGSFERHFTLPESVAGDKIAAEYKDGILSVHLPKRKEALPAPKKMITIK